MFNIPEPHFVCVFLALSLTRSPTPTLLPASSTLFLFVCVCACACVRSLQSNSLFPFTEGSFLSLRDMADRKWEFTLAYFSQKKQPHSRSCRAQVLFLPLSPPHSATTSSPPAPTPPMTALLDQLSGWNWVVWTYAVDPGAAAAVRAHSLGDRKELSVSHKQESSSTHYSQDLERTVPGKIH